MMKVQNQLAARNFSMPTHLNALLGESPVIRGESQAEYDQLICSIAEAIEPTNAIEWMWVKELADTTWEVRRAQRARTKLIEASLTAEGIVRRQFGWDDEELGMAEGYQIGIRSMKSLDRMIEATKSRRDAVLREIERRRFEIAKRLKLESLELNMPERRDAPDASRALPNPDRLS
jgi:hypothetical protein